MAFSSDSRWFLGGRRMKRRRIRWVSRKNSVCVRKRSGRSSGGSRSGRKGRGIGAGGKGEERVGERIAGMLNAFVLYIRR